MLSTGKYFRHQRSIWTKTNSENYFPNPAKIKSSVVTSIQVRPRVNKISVPSVVSKCMGSPALRRHRTRSEEHTSELQSLAHLVCRLLLEKKNYALYTMSNNTRRARYTTRDT